MNPAVVARSAQGGRVLCNSVRHKHTLPTTGASLGDGKTGTEPVLQQPHHKLHQVMVSSTPSSSAFIPMPPNVEELQASEKARFSPHRARDMSSAHIAAKCTQVSNIFGSGFMGSQGSQSSRFNMESIPADTHMDVYDCSNAVSLSSVMQTNVPKPFGLKGESPVYLNMPGGQWAQDDKYISGDLHQHHYSNITSKKNSGTALATVGCLRVQCGRKDVRVLGMNAIGRHGFRTWCGGGGGGVSHVAYRSYWSAPKMSNIVCLLPNNISLACGYYLPQSDIVQCKRRFHVCTVTRNQDNQDSSTTTQLTSRQKLQRAVKEYGATVIVFHVTISLASLGICYLLVSSGVDMVGIFKSLGINLGKLTEEAANSTVVVDGTVENVETSADNVEEIALIDDKNAAELNTRRAAGAATMVVAYAVHKVFAPVRIGITLTATPFIVRHLRRIGFLKPPQPK